ncbi:serine/threonine-protein kinase [Natranaerovirga pectinivora]|uniref:non-specific serine/threonine protein kinase n=1 Tax=Natranaerovirga pectinivora TaxID=682400 RepID=A0A4R3MK84_9FIRM|nr:serine/threonine-protein kinase [Natranaerovirga pectinivora]TCT13108.1 serine/threonine-protein kinase [Natranaerovirga pectinivora]
MDNLLFNKYEVVRKIGQGGMSEVFLVRNINLGNFWAVKVINKANGERFGLLTEPHILKELNHPAIPKVVDIEEDGKSFYIIEEFIDGEQLNTFREQNADMKEELILDFVIQLCEVLEYLHSHKPYPIIYKDLKPENILVTKDNKLKLIDFGIAQTELRKESVSLGTKGYASPEQYRVEDVDERSDIYSLGMTLFYLVTGIHGKYVKDDLPSIHGFSKELIGIIHKCTRAVPQERYQDIKKLKKEFLRIYKREKTHSIQTTRPIIIGVMGTQQRVGATHMAITIGTYLSKKGFKVLIKEHHESEDFLLFQSSHSSKIKEYNTFQVQKIDFMPYELEFKFSRLATLEYKFIVLDLGSFNISKINDLFFTDIKLIVSGGKAWETNHLEKVLFHLKDEESINYIFNFIDYKLYKEIIKGMGKLTCYKSGYNPNPFELTEVVKASLDEMFKEYLPYKKSFYRGLLKQFKK